MSAHAADYFLQVPALTLRNMITKLTSHANHRIKPHTQLNSKICPHFYITCLFNSVLGQKVE